MTRFILLLLVIVGAGGFILKIMYDFWSGLAGSRNALRRDIIDLFGQIREYDLSPWLSEEIGLISRLAEVNSKTDLVAQTKYGVYFSIYQEPLLAFALKSYNNDTRRVMALRYNDRQYAIIVSGEKVEILYKDRPYGNILTTDGIEVSIKEEKIFVDVQSEASLLPVKLNDNYVMSILAHEPGDNDQTRVIEQVETLEERDVELLRLTIAYALVDEYI